ncbi:hypothetical protein [Sphingobacterium athyrii]|nr:hypothetical protein [Sphingobacterium athyrii]
MKQIMQHSFPVYYHYIARNRKRISCYLYEDSIYCKVRTKNGLTEQHKFRYEDIHKIHLGLQDISWHTIDIYFKNRKHIHLKSVTFFIERNGEELERPKTNEIDIASVKANRMAYSNFVTALHERISRDGTGHPIIFTHGNSWKKILIWILMSVILILLPLTWKIGFYGWSLFFAVSFLLLLLFSRKINFKKQYRPDQLPEKYLPF